MTNPLLVFLEYVVQSFSWDIHASGSMQFRRINVDTHINSMLQIVLMVQAVMYMLFRVIFLMIGEGRRRLYGLRVLEKDNDA